MLLTDLLNAFAASATTERPPKDLPSLISANLTPHKDAIVGILIVGLKSSATRLPAVHGLSSLIHIPTLLTDTELGYIVLETGEFAGKEPDEVEDVTYVPPAGISVFSFLPEGTDVVSAMTFSHCCLRLPSRRHTISRTRLSPHYLPCSLNKLLLEMLDPSAQSIGVLFVP